MVKAAGNPRDSEKVGPGPDEGLRPLLETQDLQDTLSSTSFKTLLLKSQDGEIWCCLPPRLA